METPEGFLTVEQLEIEIAKLMEETQRVSIAELANLIGASVTKVTPHTQKISLEREAEIVNG